MGLIPRPTRAAIRRSRRQAPPTGAGCARASQRGPLHVGAQQRHATRKYEQRRGQYRNSENHAHTGISIDADDRSRQRADDQRRWQRRGDKCPQRTAPTVQRPPEPDTVGQDVGAGGQSRHGNETRVACLIERSVRGERAAQKLHRSQATAERPVHVTRDDPCEPRERYLWTSL
jgi:hypothetical protein